MEENIKTEVTTKEKIVAVSNAKANKAMYIALAVVAVISLVVIATSVINNNKNRRLAEQSQPTPTVMPTDSPLVSETPYPTVSVTAAPKYTNTFEDKVFFWATNKDTNEQGLYYTSPMLRQSNDVELAPTEGTFVSVNRPQDITVTVKFSQLVNIIKLGSLPSNLPYDTTVLKSGFEKNSYVFTVYDEINCVYKDNSDQCYQYYYKVVFNTDGSVNFTKVRTYAFSIMNTKRKTAGVENLIAVISPTQLAVDVNYCHGCGLEEKVPTVYIVNTKTGNETFMGMIANIKASSDGKTFTYQKMKKVPYVCPKNADDPTCTLGVYPDYDYVVTGSVLTGKLN